MNVGSHRLVLSAAVMALALAACDSGPSAPKSQVPAPSAPAGPVAAMTPGPAASATPREFAAVGDLNAIHFDLDQVRIRPQDARVLDGNARWLKSRKEIVVLVGGHADERGSDDYNARLGERRAEAVKKHLVAHGIEADRIMTTSYGEKQPLCPDHKERCWTQNRRADFQVKPR